MDNVLVGTEAETYINTMEPQTLEQIGTLTWIYWHERLQKLHQQAIIEASTFREEYVKETLVTYGKAPILVHEAILINIWKYKVLPRILKMEPNPDSTFVAYTVLYHEAVAVALLELILYHENCAETLEDSAVDLLDYVCGTISQLLTLKVEEVDGHESGKQELLRQRDDLSFGNGIRSLTIIRYLSEYLERLPLSVTSKMFATYDVPVLLTEIILNKPWIRDGKQYYNCKWIPYAGDEAISKCEIQVWLTLRQLLLDPACPTHYTMTNSRRSQLMKLEPIISPILLDQLAPLCELKHFLCRLAVSELPASAPKPVLLETMLEIKEKISAEGEGQWKSIAKTHLDRIFHADKDTMHKIANNLSEAYNTDLLEKFETRATAVECGQCGKPAIQRCSKCKKQWYCSRSCQVTHWPQHKEDCTDS